jgi:hypothetical protein
MFSYAFILGTCGLGAQYLFWLVPFLLMRGRERFAAVYSILAGLYLVLFYTSVQGTRPNHENLGAFAPLRGASWLTPGHTDAAVKTQLILLIGNLLLPLACLAFVLLFAWRRTSSIEIAPSAVAFAPMTVALAITLALFVYALRLPRPGEEDFVARTRANVVKKYNVVRITPPTARYGEPTWVVPPVSSRIEVTALALAWIAAWSGVAYLTASRTRR